VTSIGVAVIGRNEGERLRLCLQSLAGGGWPIVYVDSGSADGSVALASSLGATVVELALDIPFTAARARNAGIARLIEEHPSLEHVQFVDGDCEVHPEWLSVAECALRAHSGVAAVCGRRRERYPDASKYNRLCDIEWNTPIGDTKACGGDAMFRVAAFSEVEGFDPSLIAGEEPDLCLRLRQRGWRIQRLDAEMTTHDAAMTNFSQWWRRVKRAGYAYAEGAARYGKSPEKHWVREVRSGLVFGAVLPLTALLTMSVTRGWSVAMLGAYAVTFARARRYLISRGFSDSDAILYAAFCTLGKFPEAVGQASYWYGRVAGRKPGLIEYKSGI
jgi:glycosyltransferase involved in cell wall biosynthesis